MTSTILGPKPRHQNPDAFLLQDSKPQRPCFRVPTRIVYRLAQRAARVKQKKKCTSPRLGADRSRDGFAVRGAEGVDLSRLHFVGNTMIDTLVALGSGLTHGGAVASWGSSRAATWSSPCTARRSSTACCSPTRSPRSGRGGGVSRSSSRCTPDPCGAAGRRSGLRGACGWSIRWATWSSSGWGGAAAVLTDSEGSRRRPTYLGVPCFTLRANTERPVTLRAGTNTLLGLEPERIVEVPALLANAPSTPPHPPDKWDGHAAERVAAVLADW